jgi:hypothetical protein
VNHGGVFQVRINCDGTLISDGLVVSGGWAIAMAFLPTVSSRAVLSAGAVFTPDAGVPMDTALLSAGAGGFTLISRAQVFNGGPPLPSAMAISGDGAFALIADNNNSDADAGSRIAIAKTTDLSRVQMLSNPNPSDIAFSPFGNAALVTSTLGDDHIRVFKYDAANAAAPFTDTGDITYTHGRPQLPQNIATIGVGSLKGLMLVSELASVRLVRFAASGTATDVGMVSWPGGATTDSLGIVGVQP